MTHPSHCPTTADLPLAWDVEELMRRDLGGAPFPLPLGNVGGLEPDRYDCAGTEDGTAYEGSLAIPPS
jgi:hypothetical protein